MKGEGACWANTNTPLVRGSTPSPFPLGEDVEEKYQEWIENQRTELAILEDMLDTEDPEDPVDPPDHSRVDKPWWPNRNSTAGATAFPLTIRPRGYIREVVQKLQENDYNTLCAGAQSWSYAQASKSRILPGGPVAGPEWKKNLETLLDETARHKDFWVQLIPTFGYKQYDTDPDGGEYDWHLKHSKRICEIIKASDYRHVFISVMNEFKHPLTDDDIGDTDIARLAQYWQDEGFMTSTDHGGREKDKETGERIWKAYYPTAWRHFSHYNFHPTRNPEPTAHQFKKAAQRWPEKTLLYNETVCYASDATLELYPHLCGKNTIANEGRGTEEQRKWKVRDIKRHIRAAGVRSRFFFHSIWLGIRSVGIGWIPKY